MKNFQYFFFLQNIDFRRGGSNEYTQSMLWSRSKEKKGIPCILHKNEVYGDIHCTDMFS